MCIRDSNYPTVPKGTERIRITPTPCHSEEATEKFVEALKDAWLKFMPLLAKYENDFAGKVKSL